MPKPIAEERARRKAGAIVNRWMEPVYGDAEEDDGFSVILRGDNGRKHMSLLQDWITMNILGTERAARADAFEEAARACIVKVPRPAGYHGQWEGYGSWEGDMTGPECAAAIRALAKEE